MVTGIWIGGLLAKTHPAQTGPMSTREPSGGFGREKSS